MEQQQVKVTPKKDKEPAPEAPTVSKEKNPSKELLDQTDALLDEIDALLDEQNLSTEEQAAQFVSDFRQRGGE